MKNTTRPVLDRYLTEDEERRLFRAVNETAGDYARRDAAWMQLLRQTGIRIGAMSQLNVGDAQQALRSHKLVLRDEICKGGRGYSVHCNRKARQALRQLLALRRQWGYAPIPHAPLVVSRNHNRMAVRTYQQRMKLWVKKAGLDVDATPHFFRHTVGHRIIQRSTAANPLQVVQNVLNHSNINNSTIYTRPSREQIEADMEAIA